MVLHEHYHHEGGYGRFGCKRMKKVIHLGPGESQGGIATVMNNMKSNTPNGYYSEVINTHFDGSMIQKISIWKNARKLLKRKIRKSFLEELVWEVLTEKDDRCTRIAKRKYDTWPSAYASGAVVRCRRGEIWKNES